MKDYAKPQRSSTHPRRYIRPLVTVIIIILAIGLPVTLYCVRFQKTIHNRGRQVTSKIQILKSPVKKEKKHKKDDPQFDFYNLLSKKR